MFFYYCYMFYITVFVLLVHILLLCTVIILLYLLVMHLTNSLTTPDSRAQSRNNHISLSTSYTPIGCSSWPSSRPTYLRVHDFRIPTISSLPYISSSLLFCLCLHYSYSHSILYPRNFSCYFILENPVFLHSFVFLLSPYLNR